MAHVGAKRALIAALAVAGAGVLTYSGAARASVIDVNFTTSGNTYSGLGADTLDTGTVWNNIVYPGSTVGAGDNGITLTDSNGNSLPLVTLNVSGTGTSPVPSQNNFYDGTTDNPSPVALMGGYRYIKPGGGLLVTLGGIPAGDYQLFVYAAGNATSQSASIGFNETANDVPGGISSATTTAADRDIFDAGNPTTNGTIGSATNGGSGVNYAILDAQPDSSGNIEITLSSPTSTYLAVDALQLQPDVVPEPATLGTLATCGLFLLRRRRRQESRV